MLYINLLSLLFLIWIAKRMIDKIQILKKNILIHIAIVFLTAKWIWFIFPETIAAPLAVVAMGGWVWLHQRNRFFWRGPDSMELITLALSQIPLWAYLFSLSLHAWKPWLMLLFSTIIGMNVATIFVSIIMIPIFWIDDRFGRFGTKKTKYAAQEIVSE